ncbi:HAD-IA family hydrolase [Luteimonas terrae]|uniref:Hydrolase of the HAD superfamily n=1 Tax=Luteimonas terrae TaxID=1530191 RepID=A0ABU1Y0W8_9GAMM|nr:HAD-IA family hydrolase [Luteimonas terrae]MDR7194665.1 putative hydrolase of the HAD superfamily [Luteimonas terrae]
MKTPPPVRLVLFDFDGVLARYSRHARLASLARVAGCTPARVAEVLFDSGLERAYDSGALGTATYLQRLGDGLGCRIDPATWIDARVAAMMADPAVLALVAAVASRAQIGVLTNNGALLLDAMPRIVAPLFPLLDGRVLCSGALGVRKPDRAIFDKALAHFDARAQETLFVDDLFVNVQGARVAGLHADTVVDARSMRKLLRRYGLA